MDWLKKLDKNRGFKGLELMLEEDKKKHRKIYVGSYPHMVYLKSFCGMFDFQKFMVEAVILRMLADKVSLEKARDVYNKIYDGMEKAKKVKSLD